MYEEIPRFCIKSVNLVSKKEIPAMIISNNSVPLWRVRQQNCYCATGGEA